MTEQKPVCAGKLEGVRLVAFDLDGTLVDAFEDIALAANHLRSRYGLPALPLDAVKRYVGHGARQLIGGVLGITDSQEIEENHACLVEFYTSLSDSKAVLYEGVLETLIELRNRGYCLAVATNKPHAVTVGLLARLGVDHLFNIIRGEAEGLPRKPWPDLLRAIMEEAGVEDSETVMVGDSDVDIAFARNAGARVVVVPYGQHSPEHLASFKPDWILSSFNEMLLLLDPLK